MGGTISAEHGIGVAKTPWLHLIRTSTELAAQAAIRRALDPQGLLNQGVLDTATDQIADNITSFTINGGKFIRRKWSSVTLSTVRCVVRACRQQ